MQASNPHLLLFIHWPVGSLPLVSFRKPQESGDMYIYIHTDESSCCMAEINTTL